MAVYLEVVLIIMAVALSVLVLIQMRNAGLGGVFGGADQGVTHTRRGIDRLLFNVTIAASVVFFVVALLAALFGPTAAG